MNKTLVAYCSKGGVSEGYAKIIAETFIENRLAVEICNLAHDIPDVADFEIQKKRI